MSSDSPSSDTPKPAKKPRYYYGWNIVGASFLAHLAYAEQFSSTLGLFMRPLKAEFGWSRSQIALVQTMARIVEAVTAPFVGPLIDRFGTRLLMPMGAIIAGLSLLLVTQVDALWQFYIVRGLMAAIGFALMGSLVTSIAVNNWFIKKRGRALAIVNVGSTFSNVILMPVAVFVISVWGWRSMFILFAIVTWIVVLAPSALLMRRRPEDMGLRPDGIDPNETDEETLETNETGDPTGLEQAKTREPIWTRLEAMKTRAFWLIALCFAIGSLAFQGINISLAPYVQDLGYSDAIVATALLFRAIVMTVTLPAMGFIAEHSHRALVRALPFILQGTGSLLFLMADDPVILWTALAVYGMGVTSIGVTQEVLWANYFGRFSLGRIRSAGFLVTFGFGATGPVFMNLVFDALGSYKPAFALFLGFFAVAAFFISFARPPQPHRYATAEELQNGTGSSPPSH